MPHITLHISLFFLLINICKRNFPCYLHGTIRRGSCYNKHKLSNFMREVRMPIFFLPVLFFFNSLQFSQFEFVSSSHSLCWVLEFNYYSYRKFPCSNWVFVLVETLSFLRIGNGNCAEQIKQTMRVMESNTIRIICVCCVYDVFCKCLTMDCLSIGSKNINIQRQALMFL